MSRTRRLALITGITAAGVLGVSGVALADDAHQICVRTLICTGPTADLHDIPVTVHDVILRILSV